MFLLDFFVILVKRRKKSKIESNRRIGGKGSNRIESNRRRIEVNARNESNRIEPSRSEAKIGSEVNVIHYRHTQTCE